MVSTNVVDLVEPCSINTYLYEESSDTAISSNTAVDRPPVGKKKLTKGETLIEDYNYLKQVAGKLKVAK